VGYAFLADHGLVNLRMPINALDRRLHVCRLRDRRRQRRVAPTMRIRRTVAECVAQSAFLPEIHRHSVPAYAGWGFSRNPDATLLEFPKFTNTGAASAGMVVKYARQCDVGAQWAERI
jgi:hypothetical protein